MQGALKLLHRAANIVAVLSLPSKRRFLYLTLTFAALAVAALLARPASATALYTVQLSNGCFGTSNATFNSSTPVTASATCTNNTPPPFNITEQGFAAAGPGHVGTSLNVSEGLVGPSDADAIFSMDVTFTSTTPTTQDSIPVSLNLLSAGVLSGSNSFDTAWELLGQMGSLQFSVGGEIDTGGIVQTNINGANFNGTVQTLNGGALDVAGGLTTSNVIVPINTPIFVSLHLSIGGFANPGTFDDQFGDSIDFPIGSDVFNLPAGFTANDDSGIVVNNRFGPVAAAVPEPGSMLLLVTALIGLAIIRCLSLRHGGGVV